MLRLIKNNSPFTVITLFIFTLLVKFRVLFQPVMPDAVPNHFLYNYILNGLMFVFGKNSFWYIFLAIFNIFLQSIYIVNITGRHKLFHRVTYVPAYVYLVFTSIYPIFNVFSETVILNWLLLGAVDIMFGFSHTTQPRKLVFNAGFLFCLAALFQFTLLIYVLLLLVGLVMFRSFNIGEYSVAIIGFFTPLYFLACFLFLSDKLRLLGNWVHIGFSFSTITSPPLYLIITVSTLIVFLIIGIIAMQRNVAFSNIYIRRDWTVVSFYLIISVFVGIFTDENIKSAWLITIPALSIIVSHAFMIEKKKRISSIIFYFSLLYILFCLWANK